jgi:hypothetical protein
MLSESPMDATRVSILNSDRPGSNADNPMVYVHSSSVQLRVTQSAGQLKFDAQREHFTHSCFFKGWGCYSGWLNITTGEILHKDSGCVMKAQLLSM